MLFESISYLHGLTYLDVDGSDDIVFFPDVMLQNLPSLRSLEFMRLANFIALKSLPDWFGEFESLQEFLVENCPRLTSLPMSIQSLTKLQKLYLISCPELQERCRETGEDRHKISHIPEVYKAFLVTNRYREFKIWLQYER